MITVENPCEKNVFSMPRCGNTYACSFCTKNVTDLRHKTTAEVEKFTAENKNACVIVHARHETEKTNQYTWFNRFENNLLRAGWKRTAFAMVTLLVFITSCNSKKPHTVGKFKEPDKKEKNVS